MAKKKNKNYLDKAKELADILLHQTTGGVMGTPPGESVKDKPGNFTEMKGLLDMMLRIHALELKEDPDDDAPSAFEMLQKERKNVSKKAKSGSQEWIQQRIAASKPADDTGDAENSDGYADGE